MTQMVKGRFNRKVLIPLLILLLIATMSSVLAIMARAEEAPVLPAFDIPALTEQQHA